MIDRTNRVVSMQRLTNTLSRTIYPLATDWSALRTSLAASGSLVTTTVLEGVLDAAFRFTTFNPCSNRRLVLDVQLDDDHGGKQRVFPRACRGGMHFELGGIIDALQRHTDCQ